MCFHIKASSQPPPPFFFWSLCFILILSYIIVFTWSSIIYKNTKHSSLVSQLVLIREVPTKSAELQRFAPEKNLACCPCRPLLPSTAHMRKERIKKKKKVFSSFHSPTLPDTCKHANAHGDLLPTADLLFIRVPAARFSPPAAARGARSRPHLAKAPRQHREPHTRQPPRHWGNIHQL